MNMAGHTSFARERNVSQGNTKAFNYIRIPPISYFFPSPCPFRGSVETCDASLKKKKKKKVQVHNHACGWIPAYI